MVDLEEKSMRLEPITKPTEGNRNRASISAGVKNTFNFFDNLFIFFQQAIYKSRNLAETNFDLACNLVAMGRIDNALFRFKVVLWLEPEHIEANYNMGCLLLNKGERQAALDQFTKTLQLSPRHENAIFMIATINPKLLKDELLPVHMPYAMALELFEGIAADYDPAMEEAEYSLPQSVYHVTEQEIGQEMTNDLIDLGCGTGLCGVPFRELFSNTVGVDMANNMLDYAYQRVDERGVKIYTRLIHQEIRYFLSEAQENIADVVTCICVAQYLGELDSIFEGVKKILRPGGIFVCSFETHKGTEPYTVFTHNGYFAHQVQYVVDTAKAHGFQVSRTGGAPKFPGRETELHVYRLPFEKGMRTSERLKAEQKIAENDSDTATGDD